MKKLLIVCILMCSCNGPPEKVQVPPLFVRGDLVVPAKSDQVGIIMQDAFPVANDRYNWQYKVMFRDREMTFTESSLRLVEHFNWNQSARKGEIEPDQPVKIDPK